MRVACWLECPSPHWRREDSLSLGALVYPMQHCAPAFIFSYTPISPLSLDFTVCMCCGSFFFPGMWPPRDPLSFLLIYTGVIQQQQQGGEGK